MTAAGFIAKAKERFGDRLQVLELPGTTSPAFELVFPESREDGEVRDCVDDLFDLARMFYEAEHAKA